jgi:hypothetical protein
MALDCWLSVQRFEEKGDFRSDQTEKKREKTLNPRPKAPGVFEGLSEEGNHGFFLMNCIGFFTSV